MKSFSKKKLAIVLYSDKNYIFALGTFLVNILKYISNIDNIIIYHDGFTDFQMECILNIDKRCLFIKYTINDLCNDFSLDEEEIKDNSMLKRYPPFIIGKCILLKHLEEYQTIIWFDSDMIVRDNLDEIVDISPYNIAWANDVFTMKGRLEYISSLSPEKAKKIKNYIELSNISDVTPTPNGGLIIINDNFNFKQAYEMSVNFVKKYFIDISDAVDEITFAYITYKMDLKLFNLENKIYNTIPAKSDINTKIIHFIGAPKPWNNKYMFFLFPQWIDNYRIFLTKSGLKIDLENFIQIHETGKMFYEVRNMWMWQELFSTINIDIPESLQPILNFNNHYFVFKYNNFLQYEINFSSKKGTLICLLWIHGKYFQDSYIENKLNDIIQKNSDFIEKLKRKDSFGAKTKIVPWSELNEVFNSFYIITYEIRELLGCAR